MNKPFLPSDLRRIDPLEDWRRYVTVKAVAGVSGFDMTQVAKRLYGDAGESVMKAAVAPASTDGWGGNLAGNRVGAFLRSLRPRSAAAQLFDRAQRFDLTGVNTVTLPRLSADFPAPAWIAEGGAIPVYRGNFASATLGPPKKLAALSGLTQELASLSAEDAEQIVREVMEDAAAKALDASVFSDTAASALRPAGVLAGVTPIAATAGGGTSAMTTDVRNLVGALADAGFGADVVLFANPRQAVSLKLQAAAGFDIPVIPALVLPAGTIVAVELGAFASGFGADPRVDIADNAVIHMEDTTPLHISAEGVPNTVAAPVLSSWQNATHVLRLILRVSYVVRQSGAVQVINGATW